LGWEVDLVRDRPLLLAVAPWNVGSLRFGNEPETSLNVTAA
jgi:hypothetical protein